MYLTLSRNKAANARQLVAIPDIVEVFERVVIVAPCVYEVPKIGGPAYRAVDLALDRRLKVTLMRKVTPTKEKWMTKPWRPKWDEFTSPRILRRRDFLATALANVRAEAAALGVKSGLYLEPHSEFLKLWKAMPLYMSERRMIAAACRRAVEVAGPVDYMLPWGGGSPAHYGYAFAKLVGESGQILGNGTYYLKDGKFRDKSNPPPRYGRQNVSPGCFVVPSRSTRQRKYWTPAMVLTWIRDGGWAEHLKKYPKAEGVWVYPGGHVGPVAKMFAEVA
jgi:hypothetical protein